MEVREILDDYVAHKRPDVTDEHGREPLLATGRGRLSKSTIRKYVYKWSRPCVYGTDVLTTGRPTIARRRSTSTKCRSARLA